MPFLISDGTCSETHIIYQVATLSTQARDRPLACVFCSSDNPYALLGNLADMASTGLCTSMRGVAVLEGTGVMNHRKHTVMLRLKNYFQRTRKSRHHNKQEHQQLIHRRLV